MKFRMFLHECINEPFWRTHCKICFVVPEQSPILFFTQFISYMRNGFDGRVERLDIESEDYSSMMSRIETIGFLSAKTFYWLGNISNLSTKKRAKWIGYVQSYQGLHSLGICLNQEDAASLSKAWLIVDVPPTIDRTDFELIARLFNPQKSEVIARLSKYCSPYTKLSVDKACLLLWYGQVLGNNLKLFCDEWLPMLVESEHSLFKVSEYFLSKRGRDFFLLWGKVKSIYPEVFWIAFWSDTLWRAYYYIRAMERQDMTEAKRMSYKLPFSFINGGWKRVEPEQLKQAHLFIYDLDYNLKNGGGTYGLELLYAKFLSGEFEVRENHRRKHERGRSNFAAPIVQGSSLS